MTGSYIKKYVCSSCSNKIMTEDSEANAHAQLGHKVNGPYAFGGYVKTTPELKKSTEKLKDSPGRIEWDQSEEYGGEEPEEEGV